jgi:hypothetical protein
MAIQNLIAPNIKSTFHFLCVTVHSLSQDKLLEQASTVLFEVTANL